MKVCDNCCCNNTVHWPWTALLAQHNGLYSIVEKCSYAMCECEPGQGPGTGGLTLCTGSGEQCGEVFSGITWKSLHIILGLFLETTKKKKWNVKSEQQLLFNLSNNCIITFTHILVSNVCKICTWIILSVLQCIIISYIKLMMNCIKTGLL